MARIQGETLEITDSEDMQDYYINKLSERTWNANKDDIEAIVVSDGITKIGSFAFAGCSSLESVALPDSVVEIGASAFKDCRSLPYIYLPGSVLKIGAKAFHKCDALKTIETSSATTMEALKVRGYGDKVILAHPATAKPQPGPTGEAPVSAIAPPPAPMPQPQFGTGLPQGGVFGPHGIEETQPLSERRNGNGYGYGYPAVEQLPCILLVHYPKSGSPLTRSVNEAITTLIRSCQADSKLRDQLDMNCLTFGGRSQAECATSLDAAIMAGLEHLSSMTDAYDASGTPYYRPLMFILTKGADFTKVLQPATQERLNDALNNGLILYQALYENDAQGESFVQEALMWLRDFLSYLCTWNTCDINAGFPPIKGILQGRIHEYSGRS